MASRIGFWSLGLARAASFALTLGGAAAAGPFPDGAPREPGAVPGPRCPPTPPPGPMIVSGPTVVLRASRSYHPPAWQDGKLATGEALSFAVPAAIPVTVGSAGNHLAELSFESHSEGQFKCSYRGGSRTSHPRTDIDRVGGGRYELVHCTRGIGAGATVEATRLGLRILNGDSRDPAGRTEVELRLGGAGSSELPPPVGFAETVRLRSGFSWTATRPLSEWNEQGDPALWYMLIYVGSREQVEALDELQIHYDSLPLFAGELAPWRGTRGVFTHPGDGQGVFVFAFVPGVIYNALRDAALDGEVVFPVVALREVPRGARLGDGSVSYAALRQSGFVWRNGAPPPADVGAVAAQGRVATLGFLRNLVRRIAQATKWVVETVERGIGVVDRWVNGKVNLTVETDLRNTDPYFGGRVPSSSGASDPSTAFVRAWGPAAGTQVGLRGLRIRLRQTAAGFLPTLFTGSLDGGGRADFTVTKNSSTSICLVLDTPAAILSELLLPLEVCDFSTYQARTFSIDTTYSLKVQEGRFNVLAQLTEARAYLRQVVGHEPKKAEVLVGPLADKIGSVNGGRAFAPCFGFPNAAVDVILDTITAVISLIPAVGPALAAAVRFAAEVIAMVDIVLPATSITLRGDALVAGGTYSSLDSRGVATHEYGHFALCSLMSATDPMVVSTAYSEAMISQLQSGSSAPPADAEPAYINEAFADFFTGQTAGGVNYFVPPNSVREGALGPMSWCDATKGNCLEHNCNADSNDCLISMESNGFLRQIARFTTTLHDFFDGRIGQEPPPLAPGNADAWKPQEKVSPKIVYSTTKNGATLTDDEVVELEGRDLRTALRWWRLRGPLLRDFSFLGGLADTASGAEYDWCQVCDLFARHDSRLPTHSTAQQRYALCAQQPLASWVGPAPDRSLPTSCNYLGVGSLSCATDAMPDATVDLLNPPIIPGGAVLLTSGATYGQPACPEQFVAEFQNQDYAEAWAYGRWRGPEECAAHAFSCTFPPPCDGLDTDVTVFVHPPGDEGGEGSWVRAGETMHFAAEEFKGLCWPKPVGGESFSIGLFDTPYPHRVRIAARARRNGALVPVIAAEQFPGGTRP